MVDFKRLSDRAKDLMEKRGGTDGLKRDAAELKGIATGQGTLSEKAKRAADALKTPQSGRGEDQPRDPAAKPAGTAPASQDAGPSGAATSATEEAGERHNASGDDPARTSQSSGDTA